jgi:hypothetical protein
VKLEKRVVQRSILSFKEPAKDETKRHRQNQKDENEDVGQRGQEVGLHLAFEDDPNIFHGDDKERKMKR